jgi:methanogenic corrinoid protein MtbC1
MSSFTRDGLMHEGGEHSSSRFETWPENTYAPDTDPAVRTGLGRNPVEARMALLLKAIENEIIPRLMISHRSTDQCLTLPALTSHTVTAEDVLTFAKLVLSADENLARACVQAMRLRGISVETIYLDLLAPAARHLGELWEQDLCDFIDVTVGLGRLQQVLRELSPAFGQSNDRPANGRCALLLPCPGEQHTFGLVMVAEFFRRAGWDVAGGESGPERAPTAMAKQEWFDVIGFSLAGDLHVEELRDCIRAVRAASLNPDVVIMVGGPAFVSHPEYVAQIQADAVASDGAQAPQIAESLVAMRRRRA